MKSNIFVAILLASQSVLPTTLPQQAIPTTFPQQAIPTTLPQQAIPTTLPQQAIPTTLPQRAIPTTLPQRAIPTTLPQQAESGTANPDLDLECAVKLADLRIDCITSIDLTDSGSMMAFCQGSCLQNITNVYSECPGVEENFILSIIEDCAPDSCFLQLLGLQSCFDQRNAAFSSNDLREFCEGECLTLFNEYRDNCADEISEAVQDVLNTGASSCVEGALQSSAVRTYSTISVAAVLPVVTVIATVF